ncbi:MAG: response regulator [Elusimicrobia bacterium]|nr:response regulator [Elusimicrobiota bacterium]MBD3412440.1 response regulator [Elusimicrobiota bacterium]
MQKKILIVDDEETTVQLIEFILEKNGFITHSAENGKQALACAKHEHPDAILLDIMMPGMDGLEVCAALKADESLKDIPIIFLTALGQETDVARGLKLGAQSYVTKPFNPSDLLHQVKLALKQ